MIHLKNTEIENLVFEGGGTKGAAYVGCMKVMNDLGLLHKVKRVAGTSAGSITAALLACGSGYEGLKEAIDHTDFSTFVDDKGWILSDIYRLFWHYGFHTADPFVAVLKKYIGKYGGDPELTFAQLDQKIKNHPNGRFKHLTVISSNLTRQKSQIFDHQRSPDLPIWKAVRASMSIPLIFEPFQIKGDYYVDGGLSWIFPIDVYDKTHLEKNGDEKYERNPATLGFYLEQHDLVKDGKEYNPPSVKINSLRSFATAMIGYMMETANSKHLHPDDVARTVFIDDLGVSGTTFNTSKEMIQKLIESGRKATEAYFDKRNA